MSGRPIPKKALLTAADTDRQTTARFQRWAQVTARDLMRTNVVTIADSTPLSDVEKVLVDSAISGAPVTDPAGRIVGVISWRDVVERYTQDPDARPRRGRGYFHLSSEEMLEDDFEDVDLPAETEDTAGDVMTAQVFSVPPSAGLKEIASTMLRYGIHRVLVQDGTEFLGLISTREVLEALSA